jgi:hypothetical protein
MGQATPRPVPVGNALLPVNRRHDLAELGVCARPEGSDAPELAIAP